MSDYSWISQNFVVSHTPINVPFVPHFGPAILFTAALNPTREIQIYQWTEKKTKIQEIHLYLERGQWQTKKIRESVLPSGLVSDLQNLRKWSVICSKTKETVSRNWGFGRDSRRFYKRLIFSLVAITIYRPNKIFVVEVVVRYQYN
jgi:hypothetical protein